MGQQWTQKCKDCGKYFGYSDLSMQLDQKKGLSKPERCPEHRKQHALEINTIASSHFSLRPIKDKPSILGNEFIGKIFHESRIPKVEFKEPDSSGMDIGMNEEHLKLIYPSLEKNKVLIVVAPTGSGKSTYLPTKLLYPEFGYDVDHFTKHGPIVVTQPRILATSGIANSIGEKFVGTNIGPGYDIGFSHGKQRTPPKSQKNKFEFSENDETELDEGKVNTQQVMSEGKKFSSDKIISGEFYDRRNRLLIVTDGKLINTIANGRIREYGIVFIDEAHERSMNIDFILASLRNELIKYKHLKLIVASATIDADAFRNFFLEVNLPTDIIDLSECRKKSDYEEMDGWKFSDLTPIELKTPFDEIKAESVLRNYEKNIVKQLVDKIYTVYNEIKQGDILGFLHGARQIEECIELLKDKFKSDNSVIICPLHATITERQKAIYEEHEENKKKGVENEKRAIYIGTNQAETSITFANLISVVDTGLIKQSGWNPYTCREELRSRFHSKDGCKQRWGRVGRKEKGYVFRLYTKEMFINYFPQHTVPEISRGNMEDIIVKAKASGINDISSEQFGWLDKPNNAEILRATNLFKERNLTDEEYDFTAYGREVYALASRLSVFLSEIDRDSSNRTLDIAGLLILADKYGCLIEAATLIVTMPHLGENSFADAKKIEDGKDDEGLFIWNYKWDLKSKYVISKLHQEIMCGCIDDLDFSCKLLSLFEQSICGTEEDFHPEWMDRYFINKTNFQRVIDAREDLLDFFVKGKKTDSKDSFRSIDLSKIPILRLLITIAWPDRKRLIREEENRFLLIDEKSKIKGLASKLSAFNSFGDNSVIVGMFDNSEVSLNPELRESPIGSFLIKVTPTHLDNKSSVYELLTVIKAMKKDVSLDDIHQKMFSHLQAPFNSKVTFNNPQKASWEIQRAAVFIPQTIEGVSTNAFNENKIIYDDSVVFKRKNNKENQISHRHIQKDTAPRNLPIKETSRLTSGFISGWSTTQGGDSICELTNFGNAIVAQNQIKLKNEETLTCEFKEPIYDLPLDRLIGFIAEDAFGQLRTISAWNLSIHGNNPAVIGYLNKKIDLKYSPSSKNIHDDFCLSLLERLEEDLETMISRGLCTGYVSEILSDRVQFILCTEHKFYHVGYIPLSYWRVKESRTQLSLNRQLLLLIKPKEYKKEPEFRIPSGITISNLHVSLLKKMNLKYENQKIIVTPPFSYKKFTTILSALPFNYSEIRKNYSDTNSISINDFIFPENLEELKRQYSSLLEKIAGENSTTTHHIKSFKEFMKSNSANIPKLLQNFCWDNIKIAEMLAQLPPKKATLQRWEKNLESTRNETRRNELIGKIFRISEEIATLSNLKLAIFPY